jgi:hypothetical protein
MGHLWMAHGRLDARSEGLLVDYDTGLEWPCIGHLRDLLAGAAPPKAAETIEAPVGNAERDEDIRRRAYEIYLERGEQPGRELDDWLQAERELEGVVLAQAC